MSTKTKSDELDYALFGEELQFVEIELDPGETVIAEAGAMMFMSSEIKLETQLGSSAGGGVFGALVSVGKRFITGESLFLATFTHTGSAGKAHVAFAAGYPGTILPLKLSEVGNILCQKDSYLCSAKGIDINLAFTKKLGAGLFGGEGFILQKLEGDGLAFVHAGGTVHCKELAAGEKLKVDTGCIAAFQESVAYDIEFVGGIKSAFFGGEGLFFATLTGPGKVWLQSMPFSRLADRLYRSIPLGKKGGQGQGGVLGTFLQGE